MSSETSSVVSDVEEPMIALPEYVTISRRTFDAHVRGHAFKSWVELVRALPGGMAPQGASLTSVKCDPMQVFAWVATLLIQICIWGLVTYSSSQSLFMGIVVASAYGVALWLCISWVPRQMAGMLWPNLPIIVGAVGLQATMLPGQFERFTAAKLLLGTIAPSTVATSVLMRKLPEDPDRAVLVTNLFLGLWSGTVALGGMFGGEWNDFMHYWASCSLVVLGAVAIGVAAALSHSPGRWGSVDLVTWTLNVGSLAVDVGSACSLFGPATAWEYEMFCWVLFFAVSSMLALLGLKFNRTFPVLLSAVGIFSVCVRVSFEAQDFTQGNAIVGLCTFGGLGIGIILAARYFLKSGYVPTSRENLF